MKVKVSDYVAEFLVNNGVTTVFTVVGGGAMYLNDSLGHKDGLKCVYNHHEQASAIAAEAYFRVNNEMAACCVTSGPGAINALNGVIGAYQDSIPMIVLSGQTKTSLMTSSSGLPLRTFGNQEYEIIPTLQNAVKYAVSVKDPLSIRYELEKAFYLARNGRPGPCWIEIPLDIQGYMVEIDELSGFSGQTETFSNLYCPKTELPEETYTDFEDTDRKIDILTDRLKKAERPVIYAGNGIRISGAAKEFAKLVEYLKIPVVTGWVSIDLIDTDSRYYAGRGGIMGDRAGNFAVQNSDLIIAIGNRLSIYQIGYHPETWAREAYKAVVDIDPLELKKPTLDIDLPICEDAGRFMTALLKKEAADNKDDRYAKWIDTCNQWKKKYPVVSDKHRDQDSPVNVYALIDMVSRSIPQGTVSVVANGSASVVGSAAYYIGHGSRFIMNCALSSMGYDLPASIGACEALTGENEDKADLNRDYLVCIAGDGSIMMNLQELQTIVTNKLPVKIIVINNDGYHQIRLTQTNVFNKNFVGIGPESRDLGFPDFEKIAGAFGIPYFRCDKTKELNDKVSELLETPGYSMLEVICDTGQVFEPKSATRRLEDGTLVSPPLEDLAPFLPREELEANMFIPLIQ